MSQGIIIEILLALIALGIPFGTWLNGTRSNKQQAFAEKIKAEADAKGVDALAYDRATTLWEKMIADLRTQVDRLEGEVASLRQANTSLVQEVSTLRLTNSQLGGEVVSLRAEISAMHGRKGDSV